VHKAVVFKTDIGRPRKT